LFVLFGEMYCIDEGYKYEIYKKLSYSNI